ncbi:hypothetical protein ACFQ21_13255 [Ohtaekwangia kribbensis]|uniref:Uncharacterized protein n=1 Tax=Ohtaekwangia kribbensis TaxID=688913 RepID=A0ABW3K3X4_9BACT
MENNSAQSSLNIAQYDRSEVYTHAFIGEDEDTNKVWAWCYPSNCIYSM